MDFGFKSSRKKSKKALEVMLKDVKTQKRQNYLKELKLSKNKEKTFQKIVNENMVMYSERKMLLRGGDKNRFSHQRAQYNSMNDVYKDEKLVFNRVKKSIFLFKFSNRLDPQNDVHGNYTTIPVRSYLYFRLSTKLHLLRCCKNFPKISKNFQNLAPISKFFQA
jgi:hypothetical protein